MKKSFLLAILLLAMSSYIVYSQEVEQKPVVNVSGYAVYEMIFDTYKSYDSRDGEVYLYPRPANYDINGDDINRKIQTEMLSLNSRINIAGSGVNAFGAKAKGVIEGDFLGTSQDYTRMFRLRHAYVQLNWSKTELLLGQYWHPMFVTSCFPAVVSFGAGVPFNILNRSPQVRLTVSPSSNLDLMVALLIHGDFKSVGPAEAQRNSGIPDLQFQFRYKNDMLLAGLTAGYKFLTPRLVTANNLKTNETVGSFNVQVFGKVTTSPVTVKIMGIYGQNLSHFTMIGGYGASQDPAIVDDYSYTNLNTMSVWSELHTNGEKFVFGFFGGYSANLGSYDKYYSLSYARNEDIAHIFRLSPRVEFKSGRVSFLAEYMLAGAAYATEYTSKHRPTDWDKPTINNRVTIGAKYNF
ncbi:MAG: hypothetical protein A2W99_02780 [Bacteroidetes bacterium GWF2_33_16]|nr:MAG: hypothetical protein A2X00_10235 [Bacteroidetes bacterium GWE2_32_14]OFY07822.1 MAG: hypothetical protein A2W99_02780 [Bacteroidetes bacterium GWF2_33_16]